MEHNRATTCDSNGWIEAVVDGDLDGTLESISKSIMLTERDDLMRSTDLERFGEVTIRHTLQQRSRDSGIEWSGTGEVVRDDP